MRERSGWEAGRLPGSAHRPYHDVDGVPDALDPTRPIAVICASGQRAAVAASLLERHGAREVVNVVDGGVARWEREGWPVGAPGRAR